MTNLVVLAASAVVAGIGILSAATVSHIKRSYRRLPKLIKVDEYVGREPSVAEALQVLLLLRYTEETRDIATHPYKVVAEPTLPDVPGLMVTRRARKNEAATVSSKKKPPLVIGTIRTFHICLCSCLLRPPGCAVPGL